MNNNYEYFMGRNLQNYAGHWVVIAKEKVIAHGPRSRMKQMLRQARKDHPGEPLFVAKVPERVIQIL